MTPEKANMQCNTKNTEMSLNDKSFVQQALTLFTHWADSNNPKAYSFCSEEALR